MTKFGPKMGQIGPKLDRSPIFSDQIHYLLARFSIFLAGEPKRTESDFLNIQDLSHLGPICPTLGLKLPSAVCGNTSPCSVAINVGVTRRGVT